VIYLKKAVTRYFKISGVVKITSTDQKSLAEIIWPIKADKNVRNNRKPKESENRKPKEN